MVNDSPHSDVGVHSTASSGAPHLAKLPPASLDHSHYEPALVKDEKNLDRDFDQEWETDPDNARNWSVTKKWIAVFIVRSLR